MDAVRPPAAAASARCAACDRPRAKRPLLPPGVDGVVAVGDDGREIAADARVCDPCWLRLRHTLRPVFRRLGRCGCGATPTPGYATCARCRSQARARQHRRRQRQRRRDWNRWDWWERRAMHPRRRQALTRDFREEARKLADRDRERLAALRAAP